MIEQGIASLFLASTHEGGAHAPINWWIWDTHAPPIGWFILDFVLFVGLLVYFAREPLRRFFRDRHEAIKQKVETAEHSLHETTRVHHDLQKRLSSIEDEVRDMIKQAISEGQEEQEGIKRSAENYSARLFDEADTLLQQERHRVKQRLYLYAVQEVLNKAEPLLKADQKDIATAMLEHSIVELEQHAQRTTQKEGVVR